MCRQCGGLPAFVSLPTCPAGLHKTQDPQGQHRSHPFPPTELVTRDVSASKGGVLNNGSIDPEDVSGRCSTSISEMF